MHMPPLFCIKTNLRENRFFAARLAIGDEKGSHNVNFLTKKQTKQIGSKHTRVGNGVERMYAYNGLCERVQCMLLMGNGNSSMQTKLNKSHSLALCSLCSYVKNTYIYVKTRNESLQTSLHPRVRAYHIIYFVVEIIGSKLLGLAVFIVRICS